MSNKDMRSLLLDRLRKRCGIDTEEPVGVWGSYGKGAEIQEHPDGGMTLKMTITTDDVDLDGEIVDASGADWSYWERRGLPVYMEHEISMDTTVGKGRPGSLKMHRMGDATGWSMTIGLRSTDTGKAAAAYVRDFGMIGSSIGFRELESRAPNTTEAKRLGPAGMKARKTITKWLGYETSLTVIPCNPGAMGAEMPQQAKSSLEWLERGLTKGTITKAAAYALGFPETEPLPQKRRRVIIIRR